MNIKITPRKLCGCVDAVTSKSDAHRKIIAAALSDTPTQIYMKNFSDDINATLECIAALGGNWEKNYDGVLITPIEKKSEPDKLNFGESGSTARFLIPVAAALYGHNRFTGKGRLPNRPFDELTKVLGRHGVVTRGSGLPKKTNGILTGGEFRISGDVSSQYISGLLFALPLLDVRSRIVLTSPLKSAAYVDMTLDTLEEFGIKVLKDDVGYSIVPQSYKSPHEVWADGDWSNAAFWICAGKLCGDVSVNNLSDNSHQGDKAVMNLLDSTKIDAGQIPDLVPILSVLAAGRAETTEIYNAARLRMKESDRLYAMTQCINALGGSAEETADGMIIRGNGHLKGGTVDGFSDHRIVMSAAIASVLCSEPVIIRGAEAVNKSYPTFFEDFKKLGGIFECTV